MSDFRLTRRAVSELFDIFVFGDEQFGSKQAEAYAAELEHVFQLLADNPRMGRKAKTISAGVRRHEHGSHVILYEEAPDAMTRKEVIERCQQPSLSTLIHPLRHREG